MSNLYFKREQYLQCKAKDKSKPKFHSISNSQFRKEEDLFSPKKKEQPICQTTIKKKPNKKINEIDGTLSICSEESAKRRGVQVNSLDTTLEAMFTDLNLIPLPSRSASFSTLPPSTLVFEENYKNYSFFKKNLESQHQKTIEILTIDELNRKDYFFERNACLLNNDNYLENLKDNENFEQIQKTEECECDWKRKYFELREKYEKKQVKLDNLKNMFRIYLDENAKLRKLFFKNNLEHGLTPQPNDINNKIMRNIKNTLISFENKPIKVKKEELRKYEKRDLRIVYFIYMVKNFLNDRKKGRNSLENREFHLQDRRNPEGKPKDSEAPPKKLDLWDDWILFKKNDYTNPTLQLKKQGANFKSDQYAEFTYRPSYYSPPSMQEFYESVLNGIIRRYQLLLYKGDFHYYQELQTCLHEFSKLLNFKTEILIEVFQSLTNLNLSKEQLPNIVVPCASCGMFIYINFYCKKCFSVFYCDKTCSKNHKLKHDAECNSLIKVTPSIFYPLQVEIHCGGDLGDDIQIYYEHEMRVTLKYRGQRFLTNLYKILLKNRWLKNNGYNVIEDKDNSSVLLQYGKKEDRNDEKDNSFFDATIQGEEDLYLKMPVIQEMRVIFLNQGAILQDIIKETYELYTHYIHIYYFPG